MRSLVRWSLAFRVLAIPVAALLLVFGVTQLRDMPTATLPEFTPPYVEIQTEALGLSAAEVEELITVPLERDLLNGVGGIETIRSESVHSLSSITLVFEPGTDLLDARQLVQERLLQTGAIPNVSQPPTMLQPLSSESRVMIFGLSSGELSDTELGLLARWTVRPRLMGVDGVANVVLWGQREHQLQVLVDPDRLRANGVTLQQMIETTGNAQLVSPLSFLEASTPGSGGFIDTPNQRLQVRHVLPIADPEGLAQVPVDPPAGGPAPTVNGRRMRIGDVAEVVEDHQPLIGDAIVDGRPGVLVVVEKFPGADTVAVTGDVEAALDDLAPGLGGVRVDREVFRPADYVEAATDNIAAAVAAGAILLALVLAAAFLRWRPLAVALVTIPLSLTAATAVLWVRGETMNALVLAGLAIAMGVIVDDAVIGADAVRRRLAEHAAGNGRSRAAVILDATLEMRGPAAFTTAILVLAVVPVFVLAGRPGDFFEPLALSYALAVLASMAVALTIAPALALLLHGRGDLRPAAELRQVRRLGAGYAGALGRVVARRRPLVAVAAVAGLLAVAVTPLVGESLVPSFKDRDFLVQLTAAPGTSRPEMVRIADRVGDDVDAVDGVDNVGANVGRAVMGDQVVGTSSSELWVSIADDADYDATVARIEDALAGYPGVGHRMVTYADERIRLVGGLADGVAGAADRTGLDALRGTREPVVVRVYGNDLDVIREKAAEVREAVAGVDGVVDPRIEPEVLEPTVEVRPDLAAIQRHGIKPGEVRRAAAALVQGIPVGALFEEQKVFEVLVAGVPDVRHSVSAVEDLRIDTPAGGAVRLEQVADVRVVPTPSVIRREAISRRLDVVADVSGRSLDDVAADIETQLATIRFPLEYHAEVLADSREDRDAAIRFAAFGLAALVGMFLLLQAAVSSWRLAALLFVTLPVALLGGIVATVAIGDGVSLGAAAGLLCVFGVAVRTAVVLVSRYARLEREPDRAPAADMVLRGAGERLVPVVATAAATAAALAPFVVPGDIAGFEILHPMAIVALAGLVTATLYTLFVVPAAYLLSGASRELAAEDALIGDLVRPAPHVASPEPAPVTAFVADGPTSAPRPS